MKRWWLTLSAALCLMGLAGCAAPAGEASLSPAASPGTGEISLSARSQRVTASYIEEGELPDAEMTYLPQLVYFSQEEMFGREDVYLFRGTVEKIQNLRLEFNGEQVWQAVAEIRVNRNYGEQIPPEVVTVLLPCPIGETGIWVEDTQVVTQLREGMEGIFLPMIYDETSYWEQNGATLMLRDVAQCGLGDGARWMFLDTDQGLVYSDWAYPGAAGAADLDDIEGYVLEMLDSCVPGHFSYREEAAAYGDGGPGVYPQEREDISLRAIEHGQAAMEQAGWVCTVTYDATQVWYDPDTDMWKVCFFTRGAAGGDETVYLNGEGLICLVVYGE